MGDVKNEPGTESERARSDFVPGTQPTQPLERLLQTVREHLPEGFQEVIQYGMIGFVVPHECYPAGYHVDPRQPLPFLSLASQKDYIALYHFGIYADPTLLEWFRQAYAALGIGKLDMGKSCIRFRKPERIPFELIGQLCSKMSVADYVALYEANRPSKANRIQNRNA